MIVRFTSTMTADEERVVASALFKAIVEVLDLLPVAYALTIETSTGQTHRHTHPDLSVAEPNELILGSSV